MRPPSSWRRRSWSSKSETRGLGSEGRRCGRALPVAALVAVGVLSVLLIFVWPARKRPFSGAFFGTTPPASGSVNEAGVSRKEDVAGVLRELEVVSDLFTQNRSGCACPWLVGIDSHSSVHHNTDTAKYLKAANMIATHLQHRFANEQVSVEKVSGGTGGAASGLTPSQLVVLANSGCACCVDSLEHVLCGPQQPDQCVPIGHELICAGMLARRSHDSLAGWVHAGPESDEYTANRTGCACYWGVRHVSVGPNMSAVAKAANRAAANLRHACACCRDGAVQCPPEYRDQCVPAGHGASCKAVRNRWMRT